MYRMKPHKKRRRFARRYRRKYGRLPDEKKRNAASGRHLHELLDPGGTIYGA